MKILSLRFQNWASLINGWHHDGYVYLLLIVYISARRLITEGTVYSSVHLFLFLGHRDCFCYFSSMHHFLLYYNRLKFCLNCVVITVIFRRSHIFLWDRWDLLPCYFIEKSYCWFQVLTLQLVQRSSQCDPGSGNSVNPLLLVKLLNYSWKSSITCSLLGFRIDCSGVKKLNYKNKCFTVQKLRDLPVHDILDVVCNDCHLCDGVCVEFASNAKENHCSRRSMIKQMWWSSRTIG